MSQIRVVNKTNKSIPAQTDVDTFMMPPKSSKWLSGSKLLNVESGLIVVETIEDTAKVTKKSK